MNNILCTTPAHFLSKCTLSVFWEQRNTCLNQSGLRLVNIHSIHLHQHFRHPPCRTSLQPVPSVSPLHSYRPVHCTLPCSKSPGPVPKPKQRISLDVRPQPSLEGRFQSGIDASQNTAHRSFSMTQDTCTVPSLLR